MIECRDDPTSLLRWAIVVLGFSSMALQASLPLELPRTDIPPSWIGEFSFLLGVSLASSLGAVFTRRERTRVALLAVQLGLLVLMGIPEGASLGIETVLSSLLIIESMLLLRTP